MPLFAAVCCWLVPSIALAQTADENSIWFSDLQDESVWQVEDGFNDNRAPPSEWAESAGSDDDLWVEDTDPRALSEFRPFLDPYGHWYQDAEFGLVWVPAQKVVGQHFVPYLTHGYWALDEAGAWIWQSDFSFGRVVFHYGRWALVTGVGWAWVPGYQYAPAWVIWRVPTHGTRYLGWTPLPPNFVWVNGVAVGLRFHGALAWVFCPSRYAFSRHLYHHRLRGRQHLERAARHTHPYPSRGRHGPDPDKVGVPASKQPRTRVMSEAIPREVRYPQRLLPQQVQRRLERPAPRAQHPAPRVQRRAPRAQVLPAVRIPRRAPTALPAQRGVRTRSVEREPRVLPRAVQTLGDERARRYDPRAGRQVLPRPRGTRTPQAPPPRVVKSGKAPAKSRVRQFRRATINSEEADFDDKRKGSRKAPVGRPGSPRPRK